MPRFSISTLRKTLYNSLGTYDNNLRHETEAGRSIASCLCDMQNTFQLLLRRQVCFLLGPSEPLTITKCISSRLFLQYKIETA